MLSMRHLFLLMSESAPNDWEIGHKQIFHDCWGHLNNAGGQPALQKQLLLLAVRHS
jgi:hypothetical protein